MELVPVLVSQNILEIRMKVAARSVLSIPTVLRIKAVFEINALTYALASAVWTPNAKLSPTYHCARVGPRIRAIHSEFARRYLLNQVFFSPYSTLITRKCSILFFTTYLFIENFSPADVPIITNPCQPSPCGPNSQCREVNHQAVCSCLPTYIGNPPNCRPECVVNAECSYSLACINNKCKDPCSGTCGQNADCKVIQHSPICSCKNGFTGDPFVHCTHKPGKHFTSSLTLLQISLSNILKISYWLG